MASYTPNYNLKKPAGTDVVDIDDLNGNMDIIDTQLNSLNSKITNLGTATLLYIQTNAEAAVESYVTIDSVSSYKWVALAVNDMVVATAPVSMALIDSMTVDGVYTNKAGDRAGGFLKFASATSVRIYGYVSGNYTWSNAKLYGIK